MENSEVKSVGAEISKKSRSLDLKSIYKSGVVKEGGQHSKGKSDDVRDDDEVRKKKRKSRKKVALSSFEPVGKRSRTSFKEVNADRLSLGSGDSDRLLSGFSQKLNSSGNLNGISLNLDSNGNVIRIPKKRRGTVGRRKFEGNNVSKPSGSSSSVDQIAKLNGDECKSKTSQQNQTVELECNSAGKVVVPKVGSSSSVDQVAKLNGDRKGKASKQKTVVELKNNSAGKAAIPKVGSSSSVDEITKLNGECKSKGSPQNQSVELKSNSAGKVGNPKVGLSSSVDQIDKLNGETKSIASQQNQIVEWNSAGKVVNPKVGSSSSVDQVAKSNGQRKRKTSHQKQIVQVDSNSAGNSVSPKIKKKSGFDDSKEKRTVKAKSVRDAKKEGGGHLLVNNGDASSKKSQSSHRKRKDLAGGSGTVAKKVDPSVDDLGGICDDFQDDDEENLEENAARMLSSRFDPSCTGFSSKSRNSESPSSNGLSFVIPSGQDFGGQGLNSLDGLDSADNANRVLRPRKRYREKGLSRKRRHFYEIRSSDLDVHWFLNRRIKVFWPLDESWYYGLVNDYDPERKLHHVKYDDRDEEWINLQNERFKLLLLPGEVPDTSGLKKSAMKDKHADTEGRDTTMTDDTYMESHTDSEPIISWLASTRRFKSSPSRALKKQKTSHLPSNFVSPGRIEDRGEEGDVGLLERESKSCSSSVLPDRLVEGGRGEKSIPESTSSSRENKFPIVYVRRRRKNSEGVCPSVNVNAREKRLLVVNDARRLKFTMASIESKQFRFELRPLMEYIFGAEIFRLFHTSFLLQHGTVVTTWPKVHLEVLFVDNIAGLRFFIFEGCLKQAVAFVFCVLTVFNEPIKQRNCIDLQMPVTSIRFKLSSVRDFTKQQVFEYYRFSRVKRCKWLYLDRKLQRRCLLTKQLPLPECTYDNIKALEDGHKQLPMSSVGSQPSFEVLEKQSVQGIVPIGVSKEKNSPSNWNSRVKHKIPPLFALSFTAAPTFFLSLHLKLLIEHSIASASLRDHDSVYSLEHSENTCRSIPEDSTDTEYCSEDAQENNEENIVEDSGSTGIDANAQLQKLDLKDLPSDEFVSSPRALVPNSVTSPVISSARCYSSFDGMSVEIPPFDQVERNDDGKTEYAEEASNMAWNINDVSPNPTGPRSLWHGNRNSSTSSPLGDLSHVWSDGKTKYIHNGFGNGPKKPRTQVQYTSPFGGFDLSSKHRIPNQNGLPYKRIRRANEKRASDGSRSSRRNLELLACDANVLVTVGDRGWREGGARVVLELADHNEWKLAVKISGTTKYSYKVRHVLQWSTNRYTHAMMWKGGKDWILEFPDRGQWVLFKEMHEECFNRNIRAASVKNIPIPGVHLIEENDDNATEVPFIRNSPKYFRQVETDVEMAMDPLRVLYDMDSDDEQWVLKTRKSLQREEGKWEEISDECFERTMDMFEKVAYAKQRDNFTADEMEELVHGVEPIEVMKVIYEHWRQKRQRKGMPLIRQLQPPSWERYQQQLKEWEQSVNKANNTAPSSGSQDKTPPPFEKPPMFAFCLKPRGLEVPNSRGTKHRSLRRFSASGHSHAVPGDHDGLHAFGRRLNGFALGDEKVMYPGNGHDSDASPLRQPTTRIYSPRDAGPGYFSLISGGGSEWNHHPKLHRNKSKKIATFLTPPSNPQTVPTYNPRPMGKRNGAHHQWNMALPDWLPSHQKNYDGGSYRHGIDGSDLDEFRLRDASGAAQHALNMAKLKREKAQRLLYRADLAIHKAVVALMAADAIKASHEESNGDDG